MAEVNVSNTPIILSLDHVLYTISKSVQTPEMILEGFKKSWDDLHDKQRLFQHLTSLHALDIEIIKENLIHRKNLNIRYFVSQQMKDRHYFNIENPFGEDTCHSCRGTGELYEFVKRTVKVTCPSCNGEKKLKVTCDKCNEVGRYVKGAINVECKFCHGTKQRVVKCFNCKGEGTTRKPVMTHVIKSTTPCTDCGGTGFRVPRKKTTPKLSNPVISADAARNLAMLIKEMPDDEIDDTAVPNQPLS